MGVFDCFLQCFGIGSTQTQLYRENQITASLAELAAALDNEAVIRLYVDRGGGKGQQAAGVALLNRIVQATNAAPIPGLGYSGGGKTVQIVYDDALPSTVVNLRQLLGWPPNQNQGSYRNVQVSLIPYSQRGGLPLVTFGFSGASDDDENVAVEIKTSYYLRLQPFLYGKADQIQFGDGHTDTITLEDVPEVGGQSFRNRGLYIQIPDTIDWSVYTGSNDPVLKRQAQVLQYIIANMDGAYDLLATYGIHTETNSAGDGGNTNAMGSHPYDQVTELIAGVMATQRGASGPVTGAQPAVIVNLDDFTYDPTEGGTAEDPFGPADSFLNGGPTQTEQTILKVNAKGEPVQESVPVTPLRVSTRTIWQNRLQYLQQIEAGQRIAFQVDPDLEEITAAIQALLAGGDPPANQRVLWVQLRPPFPQPLFQYVLSRSTLPSLFEGNNTANLAVNFGTIYYHVNRPGITRVLYPSELLVSNPSSRSLLALQRAADQVAVTLTGWPQNRSFQNYPPETFAKPYIAYRNEQQTGTYRSYFRGIAAFYQDAANDKLSLGFSFFNTIVAAEQTPLVMRAAFSGGSNVERGGDPPALREGGAVVRLRGSSNQTLDQLYAALQSNLQGGTLSLIPGALTEGTIFQFLSQFIKPFGPLLALSGATLEREPDQGTITQITAAGTTSLFGVPTKLKLIFTAPQGPIDADVRIGFSGTIAYPGLEWIQLHDPFVRFILSNGSSLSYGSVGAAVVLGEQTVDLLFGFPTPDGAWLLTALFEKPPSVNSFFQMAAGYNLVQTLPAPFSGISAVGLRQLDLAYNTTTSTAEYISFNLETPTPVPLFGNVSMGSLSIVATVTAPGSSETALATQISGTFDIGTAPGYGVVEISAVTPDFTFSGNLIEGQITLTDLLGVFLPGVPLNPPKQPSIDHFAFAYNYAQQSLMMSVDFNIQWTFSVGTVTPFTVENVGFTVSSVKGMSTGAINGNMTLFPESLNLNVTVSATYGGEASGWVFTARQTNPVELAALLKDYLGWSIAKDLQVKNLSLSMASADSSWTFTGEVDGSWDVPFLSTPLAVGVKLTAGYNGEKSAALLVPAIARSTAAVKAGEGGCQGKGQFARVEADLSWQSIDLKVWFDYCPSVKSYGITLTAGDWGSIEGKVAGPDSNGDYTATVSFGKSVTIGSIVENMISWLTGSRFGLEAPWNVLDSINLSNLALVYIFNPDNSARNHVQFKVDIGPIELGFARIDSINIGYQSQGPDKGVQVSLVGSFPWNVGAAANGDTSTLGPWDASQPGSAPAPSGSGNKYFDLRLLALGQHVSPPALVNSKTVQEAIAVMAKLPPTEKGQLPDIQFAAGSSWLVGADLGVLKLGEKSGTGTALVKREDALAAADSGYMLTLQVVFNDPVLYGLRIALAGEPAKIFKGLDFQIMYRQISATVGVYQAQITLPDAMRNLSVGAYSITLPVFAIAIYTNGDFLVDIGFPWNQDFSRSFTIQGIIYPGIPVLGSAGFYFGKLSSATSTQVPRITNGTFNPVIVFGFGLQIGFGKSIQYGVLSAGFSLTVFGILEGVIAKFNPYPNQITDGGATTQVQGAYYFWLRGTVGILGKLFGTIDFAVIKANVNVELKLMVQLTYESFVSISLTVLVSVSVSVSLKIDLGLFSITIHFSFSMQLKETFTINNLGTPPWKIAASPSAGILAAAPAARLRACRAIAARSLVLAASDSPNWANLIAAATPAPLTGYVALGLSVAHNEWDASQKPADQAPCYVIGMFIDSVAPAGLDRTSGALKAAGAAPDTPFEALCKMVFRWTVAAIQTEPKTAGQIDDLPVTEAQLDSLLNEVLRSTDANPTPIPPSAVDPFLAGQFQMTAALPNSVQPPNVTFFPAAPSLQLNVPAVEGGYPGYQYSFGGYNSIDAQALQELRAYFQQLLVQVSRETRTPAASRAASAPLSMAGWIASDYFLLIARQMVQAARDGLRDYQYPIQSGQSPHHVVKFVRDGGVTGFNLSDLFAANPTQNLAAGKPLTVGVTYRTDPEETFESIAVDRFHNQFTGAQLALGNAANQSILQSGAIIDYPDKPPYTVQQNDSLVHIAGTLKIPLNFLIINTEVVTQPGLLAQGQTLAVPEVIYQAMASDTFSSIAASQIYNNAFSAEALATLNAGLPILQPGATVVYSGTTYPVQPQDSLADVANFFKANLSDFLNGSGVLLQAGLLAPAAVLYLPLFSHNTAQSDTLQSVAGFFGTTVAVLAMQPANGTVTGLFDATAGSFLHLPHLPQFQVKLLIQEAQRTGALQNLSGMTSRFFMHGLRLPTTGITPNANGMWVESNDGVLTLPPVCGLYALTGQQIPLPAQNLASFTLTLDASAGPSWLTFASGGTTSSTIQIALDATDVTNITSLQAYATSTRLNTGITQLGSGQMYETDLASFPFTASLAWQSSGPVSLPYGTPPSGVVAPRIWLLPDSMVNLPDPATRAINPRFKLEVARYDEATGATVPTPVNYYGWASVINLTVKLVPEVAGSAATADTYEVIGAAGNDVILLERLVSEVQQNDAMFAGLLLGYQPSQTGPATQGVQTDPSAGVTMGIAQVNLSTDTRPSARLRLAALAASPAGLGLLNPPSEFVRLLWEASITASGGFYLYYFNGAGGTGLPPRIFNDKQEADLSLIVLYRPDTAADANRLHSFMNAVAIGDSIDTTNSVVFAKADPPTNPYPQIASSATASLADIAYLYYCELGDLAQANATLTLALGKTIAVNHGVFQAPLGGMSLASIAQQFGVTVAQIQAANPGPLPDPLVFPAAIRLPALTVTAGSSANTASLAAIANFYGESLAALAAENSALTGIFATGQSVTITGGPALRAGTTPPGVQSISATRPVPPLVPGRDDPRYPQDYAPDFLLNTFSLLNYRIASNGFFQSSNVGLPAGPTTDSSDLPSGGKMRAAKLLKPGDDWNYHEALPYSKFVQPPKHVDLALPDPEQSPYAGVGFLLQVEFDWQDYYGNTLVTTLTDPQAGDTGPFNQPPILTGYTDPLVALTQWPSVSSAWQALPGLLSGDAILQVDLSFDVGRYEGLLFTAPASSTTLTATFTQPLDPQTAGDPANYTLASGPAIESATLSQDGLTVQLTLESALPEGQFTLSVTGVQTAAKTPVQGQAGFSFPGDPAARSSTLQENAAKDLRVYGQLYYQIFDPNGMAFSVTSSLLAGTDSNPGSIILTQGQVDNLTHWLFSDPNSLYKFIQDRSRFRTDAGNPSAAHAIPFSITTAQINQAQIFELSLTFTMERTGGAVWGDLEATPGIRQATSLITPSVAKIDSANPTLGLLTFAQNFQQALSQPGSYLLKVATGVDRTEISSANNGSVLWAVRLGLHSAQPISYAIQNVGAPAIFAPQPISNQLQTRTGVPIFDYKTGKGIGSDPSRTLNFTGIDMDVWGRQFFAAVDGVLTPQFTGPAQIVGHHKKTDYIQGILDQKSALADIAKLWMIPAFQDETADPAMAQETFRQQLLSLLSNAYNTQAAIEFSAKVNADIADPAADQPPRLYGDIRQAADGSGESHNNVTLTSPKLTLQTKPDQPLTFLLIAPEVVTGADGQVVSYLDLKAAYHGVNIEHQISSVPGIKDSYVASSWLSFVFMDEQWPLTQDLGEFPVPIPLRSYPATPVMTGQNGAATNPDSKILSQLTGWNYAFTYTLPFHYPHDRVYCEVEFNLRPTAGLRASFVDAFAALAEFITVFPAINADLTGILAGIDATVTDQKKIDDAAVALASFTQLVAEVVEAAQGGPLTVRTAPRRIAGPPDLSYSFYIQECSVDLQSAPGSLLVTVNGVPPAGMGTPQVLIEGYDCIPYTGSDCEKKACDGKERFCFVYRKTGSTTDYLSAARGQNIPARQVVLRSLDILQRQDAQATAYIKRNQELAGRKMADPFVYTTPEAQFSNPLYPTLDSLNAVSIPSVGSSQPVTRPLNAQLTNLFAALLANNVEPALTFQVEVRYNYSLNSALTAISLPVFLQPPFTVNVSGSGPGTLAQMLADWSGAILAWFKSHLPNASGGTLLFDLVIMSNLTPQPMPLLRLRKLELPIQYLNPPLPTLDQPSPTPALATP